MPANIRVNATMAFTALINQCQDTPSPLKLQASDPENRADRGERWDDAG